jgi:hypothetical protein
MPRPRQRVCLQDGLKIDLNRLLRQGWVRRGAKAGPHLIRWTYTYTGEEIASGLITASMEGISGLAANPNRKSGTQPRYFGGRQWYFECPVTHRHCSVLWMPPGASRFCSRQTWSRQVAYASQFADPDNRAHLGQAKIRSRLINNLDPNEWDLPPKPKWMRWRTYNRFRRAF